MNPLLLASFHLHAMRSQRPYSVWLVVDAALGLTPEECRRVLGPWREWLTVESVSLIDGPVAPGWLDQADVRGASYAVGVSGRWQVWESIRLECERARRPCVVSSYPDHKTPAGSFLQEVAHHDFEIGGRNEWDGAPVRHSSNILRLLSRTHCRTYFPLYAIESLEVMRARRGGRPLRAMDIGCGPISHLRWGALHGLCEITGVDPLSEMYDIVLERHGYSHLPHIKCDRVLPMFAEDLDHVGLEGQFDLLFTNNALDHTDDPAKIVRIAGSLLREDGVFVVQVATNEGTRQRWEQLHKFDFDLSARGEFIFRTRDGVVRNLLDGQSEFSRFDVDTHTEEDLMLVLRKG
jgi:SAM-dependent methyltransferase